MHWSSTPPERRSQRHAVKSRLSVTHGLEAVFTALGSPTGDSLDFEAKDIEKAHAAGVPYLLATDVPVVVPVGKVG